MHVRVSQVAGARFEVRAREVTTIVDRLPEQGGPGDGFRPVELLLGSLGACMLGTMLGFAHGAEIPVEHVAIDLDPTVAEHPERVSRIDMTMHITGELSNKQLASLRRVAERCKVTNTLNTGAETVLRISHDGATPTLESA